MRLTENFTERVVHGADNVFDNYWFRVLATSYAIDYAFVTNEVLHNASAHIGFDYDEFFSSMFSRFAQHYTDNKGIYLFGTVANVSHFCLDCMQVHNGSVGKPQNTNILISEGRNSNLDALDKLEIDIEYTMKILKCIFEYGVLYNIDSVDFFRKIDDAFFEWNLFFNFRETLGENTIGFLQECEEEFQRILPAAEVFYDKICEANYKMNI